MTAKILSRLQQKYSLTAIEAGEFAKLKANGMTFAVRAFHAEGLGHVSVMRAKGFFGLMKMDTLIINPTEIDLPLYSYDRIFAMGNDTLIVVDFGLLQHIRRKFLGGSSGRERLCGRYRYRGSQNL